MSKVIANATNKGGEGKTMLSILLCEYAALVLGKKVLAIDLDPQANFSKYFLNLEYDPYYKGGKIPPLHPDYKEYIKNNKNNKNNWDGRSSIANIFYGEEVIPYPVNNPIFNNIDILPAHSNRLQEAEAVTKEEVLNKVHMQVKKFISLPEVQAEYDLIIIDTPPSKGPLTIAGIKACSHLVIPAQMEEDSIDGIYGMLELWKQETYTRTPSDPINLAGIIANRVRRVSLHESFYNQLQELEATRDYLLNNKIQERVIYGEFRVRDDCNHSNQSVFLLNENNIARKECESACKTIMDKIL